MSLAFDLVYFWIRRELVGPLCCNGLMYINPIWS